VCARIEVLEEGRRVHQQIIESGFESNAFVGSSLVDMYAKCGSIEDAWRVFDKMLTHDVFSWNAIGICEMWVRAQGISIVPTNATGRHRARLCDFSGGSEGMCQFGST
jgi:pentatricopeptide repeat protein